MYKFTLDESNGFMKQLSQLIDLSNAYQHLSETNAAIIIVLDHIKANDWPWKGKTFLNDPVRQVPFLWSILTPEQDGHLQIAYDIHPSKCIPSHYNAYNPNSTESIMPVVKNKDGYTLAGCSRNFVIMSERRYEIHQKTPEYCALFGLPDDCYSPDFEIQMLEMLKEQQGHILWCFERTPYLAQSVDPIIRISYMKGEFLPSRHFMYTDTPYHFLKGIYPNQLIESIGHQQWYATGRELIEEMNLNDPESSIRFEEQAFYRIEKNLVYEYVRLLLLLLNRTKYHAYVPVGPPALDPSKQTQVELEVDTLLNSVQTDEERYIDSLLNAVGDRIDQNAFKKSRFAVLDVEYIHVAYPVEEKHRSFNFPCIFSTIAWLGPRDGILANNNVCILPCHGCSVRCKYFRNSSLAYNCLLYNFSFIENQSDLIEYLLIQYEGMTLYTYGKSDIFQLEQADTFFTDSFEINTHKRRNRKRAQRLTSVSRDIAVIDNSLNNVEENILKAWIPGWIRRAPKLTVNSRFTTRYGSPKWHDRYNEAIQSCIDDAISTLLYLLYDKFRIR